MATTQESIETTTTDAAGRASAAFKKASAKIREHATELRDAHLEDKVIPALKKVPWGVVAGASLAIGGLALVMNKKTRKGIVAKVDDLLDSSFGVTMTQVTGKGKAGASKARMTKARSSRSQRARAH